MIDEGLYKKILTEGLLLDHYSLLCTLRDGKDLIKNKRIQGFLNLLCKKGYVENGILTDKGIELVGEQLIGAMKSASIDIETTQVVEFDYAKWVIQLHKNCEKALVDITGNRQVRGKIDGKPYPFLPNSTDLGKVLLRTINAYKLTNFDKIEKTILSYINRCSKADSWFPILGYYIMKNNMSSMVTDMENIEEIEKKKEEEEGGVNI